MVRDPDWAFKSLAIMRDHLVVQARPVDHLEFAMRLMVPSPSPAENVEVAAEKVSD